MSKQEAAHIEIVHALPGRIRFRLLAPVASELPLRRLFGKFSVRYNARIQTLLCEYDPAKLTQDKVLVEVAAAYAEAAGCELVHIRHLEQGARPLGASADLSLICIAADGMAALFAPAAAAYTRWLAVGTTLAAVFQHGYQELKSRGSFDPEVMSIFYLIYAAGGANDFKASLLAWLITFGRHLLPAGHREQAWMVRREDDRIVLTPVRSSDTDAVWYSLINGGMNMLESGKPIHL